MTFRIACQGIVVICCLALVGCPVTVKIAVTNESESEIAVFYPTGYESRIGIGETKKEIYDFDCFWIKAEGQLYEYQPVRPPDNYFDVGPFSSTIYAVFTDELEFKLYRKNGNNIDMIMLENGCD